MSVAFREVKDFYSMARILELNKDHTNLLCSSALVWEATIDGEIACVWGLIPPTLLSEQAYLWLYTTEIAEQHAFLLVRYSQLWVRKMQETFPILVGHCHVDAKRSQQWLRWLGASFGPRNGKLLPFVIRSANG